MKKLLLFAAAVGFVTLAPVATAADKAKKKAAPASISVEDRFKKLDTNGDGKLSPEEFKAAVTAPKKVSKKNPAPDADKLFAQYDADSDKFLSLDEFKKYASAATPAKKEKKTK